MFRFFYFTIFCLVTVNFSFGQYHTTHYIPPSHVAKNDGHSTGYLELIMTTESVTPISADISTGDGVLLSTVTLSSGSPAIYNLGNLTSPANPMVSFGNGERFTSLTGKGIIVNAVGPVSVTVVKNNISNDKWALSSKGPSGLGTTFRTGHKYDTKNSSSSNSCHVISILATEPGVTVVNIDVNGSAIFENGTGDQTINLNQGESYVFTASAVGVGENEDLNGTLIQSDKLISLLSGSYISIHASNAADSGFDQIVPVELSGSDYILTYGKTLASDSYGECGNVVAHVNNTEVWKDGVSQGVLNAGENMRLFFDTYVTGEPMAVTTRIAGTSTNGNNGTPVSACMFQDSGGGIAETGFSMIPNLSCTGVTSAQFASFGTFSEIVIIGATGGTITINGVTVTPLHTGVTVGGTSWDVYSEPAPTKGSIVEVLSNDLFHVAMMGAPPGSGLYIYITSNVEQYEVDAGPDIFACNNEQVTLTGSTTNLGLTTTNFTWNNGVTDGIPFNVTTPGEYIVTGTTLSGCTSSDTVNVIIDTVPPTASNLADTLVDCFFNIPVPDSALLNPLDNSPFPPAVNMVSEISDGNTCPETITRTWEVTDQCGNSTDAIHIILVNDTIAPVASNPDTIYVACLSDVPAPDTNAVTDEADNCTANPMVSFVSDTIVGNSCDNRSVERVFEVMDDCGNSTQVVQIINITASIPSINAGPDITICEGEEVTLTAINPDGANISWSSPSITDSSPFTPPLGLNTYTLTADVCSGECTATDDVEVFVNPVPNVEIGSSHPLRCVGDSIDFTIESNQVNENYIWDFGDGTTVNDENNLVSYAYTSPGQYDITLTVTSEEGCQSTTTYPEFIEIVPLPIANFSFSPDEISIYSPLIEFQNESMNSNSYEWIFQPMGDVSTNENPSYDFSNTLEETNTIELFAYSSAGCYDSILKPINTSNESIYFIPNTFTPDGNELNNFFTPIFPPSVNLKSYHLTIYNRWGELLFETYDPNVGWDGVYNNELVKRGTYIWKIEFKGDDDTAKSYTDMGHVNVIR